MTTALWSRESFLRLVVPGAALAAVLARLPFLDRAAAPDEAGFLAVGQQWHPGGDSLYGDYWVDRPPLLVGIFRIAAELGGLVPLRLVGCLATIAVVVGSARVARLVAGPEAGRWAAVTAAALCVSPLVGAQEVDGELLSAPFTVAGMSAVLVAVGPCRRGRAVTAAALAGAALVAALLVKQNMADVAVFTVAVLVLARRRGEITAVRLRACAAAFVTGGLVCLAAVGAWTRWHGSSLPGVFDAMYPFRLEAARVLASGSRHRATARLWLLMGSWVVSGGAVLMAVTVRAVASGRLRATAVWGVVATAAFDVVSIASGGSYWDHYLVELVVPVAVLAGVLVAGRQPSARLVVVVSAAVAAVTVLSVVPGSDSSVGSSTGRAIGRVARARDTIVTVWGHADVTEASGLSSPYPYLWSLPARTLDPRLSTLDGILAGPRAPTWIVAWSSVSGWRDGGSATARLLRRRYHRVALLSGHAVYLHSGVRRAVPRLPDAVASVEREEGEEFG